MKAHLSKPRIMIIHPVKVGYLHADAPGGRGGVGRYLFGEIEPGQKIVVNNWSMREREKRPMQRTGRIDW